MRLVDLKCSNNNCSYILKDEWVQDQYPLCPCCFSIMNWIPSTFNAKRDPFEHGVYIPDLPTPTTVHSCAELKDVCDKQGVISGYLKSRHSQTNELYNKTRA